MVLLQRQSNREEGEETRKKHKWKQMRGLGPGVAILHGHAIASSWWMLEVRHYFCTLAAFGQKEPRKNFL